MRPYFVTTSVFKRIWVFDEPEYRSMVQECFEDKIGRLFLRMVAYVIMPNHCHFVIETHNRFQIGRIMQHLKGYSGHMFKKKFPKVIEGMEHDRLWTRRYHAVELKDDAALQRSVIYIINNPARANLNPDQFSLMISGKPTIDRELAPRSLPWGSMAQRCDRPIGG